ncbi:MAG: pyridoxamine 5'-phosphate oxidase family protein [Dysosmobacter welbionis]
MQLPIRYLLVPMPQDCAYFTKAACRATMGAQIRKRKGVLHERKSKKYVDLFRRVKIAAAATVDAEGHPRARIINVMLAEDDGMYIVTSRGKPFYKQLVETERSPWQPCVQTASP